MPPKRIWIMDGHNIIFAVPHLQRLQVSGQREEARAGLVDHLERFAIARTEKVLVVFDGNQMLSNPDAVRTPLFEAVYSRRGEGVADDRILHEARRCHERGIAVTVVTNDVRTLARDLPRGVRHLGVAEFWLKHIEKGAAGDDAGAGGGPGAGGGAGTGAGRAHDRRDDKRVEGDFSDLERAMLALDRSPTAPDTATKAPAFEVREPAPGAARPPGPGKTRPAARPGDTDPRDRIRQKRERGRLRQERHLKRRAKPAGRR